MARRLPELLLLDVHRAAQHDRARFSSLCQVERLAHGFVRVVRRVQAHEAGFARRRRSAPGRGAGRSPGRSSDARRRKRRPAIRARQAVTSAVASWVTPGPQVAVATPGAVRGARPAVRHAEACAFVTNLEHLHAASLSSSCIQYMLPSPIMPNTCVSPSALKCLPAARRPSFALSRSNSVTIRCQEPFAAVQGYEDSCPARLQ